MPSHPRIKICGMTREEDLAVVATLPVSYVGFVFWPESPRAVTPQRAAELGRRVPPDVLRVGVFVNASASEVARTVAEAGLQAVQLHGDEAIEEFLGLDVALIKAVNLRTDDDVERAGAYPRVVRLLVDAPDEIRRGGTGRPADWALAAKLAARREVLLAGGLSAANVADAIRRVRPWGVDVSSGVEEAPGRKNAAKIAALVRAVVEDSPEVA